MKENTKKALFIGNNEYDFEGGNLQACVRDAEEMSRLLSINGNGDPNFDSISVGLTRNLTNAQLKRKIEQLLQPERSPDHALFYYSGHGHINSQGGHLIGKDANRDDLGVSMQWLVEQLNQSSIPFVTVILDCCFSGAFGNQTNMTGEIEKGHISCLRENVTLLAATTDSDVATEGPLHGAFTQILIQGLEGAAAGAFGQVTAASLYALADSYFSVWQQRPVFKASLTTMRPLRHCQTSMDRGRVRSLTHENFFKNPKRPIQLRPSDITNNSISENRLEFITRLFEFHQAGLVTCSGYKTVFEAALNSGTCRLSPAGEFTHKMIQQGRL